MTRNKGFSIVEVVIVIAVIGLIGLIGWRVWDAQQNTGTEQTDTTQTETTAPDVNSEADLDKADDTLDAMNVEGEEAKQLESETSF